MTVGERIKSARKQAGMTQAALALKLGISYQGVAQWENNLRNPKFETINRIADALNVSAIWLQTGVDNVSSDFAKLLSNLRYKKNLSATQLSVMTDISLSRIQDFEFSNAVPTTEELFKLSNALKIPVATFYRKPRYFSKTDKKLISDAIDAMVWSMQPDPVNSAIEDDPTYQILNRIYNALGKLNPTGQSVAVERVEELTKIPDYKKAENPADGT